MSFATTAALGAVSGLTILLGLPIARWGRPGPRLMSFLTLGSVGVLLFIFYDVIRNASQTIEAQMSTSLLTGALLGLLLAAGIAAGLFALVVFERLRRRVPLPSGPGAMAAAAGPAAAVSPAFRTALVVAIGIGLHNFSEGLAIGQSAANGAYRFFYLLVIGFGLHNVTEGFGVAGPLLRSRPSFARLGRLGLIAGGPTFVGTVAGFGLTQVAGAGTLSDALSVLFLALAAGAIVYVVGELQHAGRRMREAAPAGGAGSRVVGVHEAGMAGLLAGFLLAYGTDLLLRAIGA
ncbi:MAG: ZIP family metal transporter [Candidatus Dormibacteria bacterium]